MSSAGGGVELPRVVIFEESGSEADAGRELATYLGRIGITQPFVVHSDYGARLAAHLDGPPAEQNPADADQSWAAEMGSRARRAGADGVVAIGGGRCIDIGKLAAARAGLTLICVPTQLSHDGICSPVAVVPNEDGVKESVGAVAPRSVFMSMPTLVESPVEAVRAGLGDLLANPLALRDWALAAQRGVDDLDQRAWDLSVEAFELIESVLDDDPRGSAKDPAFWRRLVDALVLSGYSMITAGSSRPASGGEHEISHALDEIYGGKAMHGAQVAFGCIVSVALYGEDAASFRGRLSTLGLPEHPRDLGLDEDATVGVLMRAPGTRPGRFTILEDSNLDRAGARALVRRIWGD